jgi:hypothetical protein
MAGPTCSICSHPDRALIDQDIALGKSQRKIGADFEVSRDAVSRHSQNHLSPALKKAITRRESAGPTKALDRLEALYSRGEAILDQSDADGKPVISLAAMKELRATLEVIARITGELDERPTVQILNVASNPEWVQIRSTLLEALAPYPEAAAAVGQALAGMASSSVRELTR